MYLEDLVTHILLRYVVYGLYFENDWGSGLVTYLDHSAMHLIALLPLEGLYAYATMMTAFWCTERVEA